jgi:hypothetical protein
MTATITQKSLMISLLQRVLASHVAVINGDEKSAPAHVARCIKRILGAIRADSRSGSPSFNQSATEADMSLQELFGQFVSGACPDTQIHVLTAGRYDRPDRGVAVYHRRRAVLVRAKPCCPADS